MNSNILDNPVCSICPRNCHINRQLYAVNTFCRTSFNVNIASICLHSGEEPAFGTQKGICNVFFSHCNLQCIYCQNYQISNNQSSSPFAITSINQAVEQIIAILDQGISYVGFVSPSHQITAMIKIIEMLHRKNYTPTIIYNSNGYEKVNTLKAIEPYVDIYLPDFKYADDTLAVEYSQAPHYKTITTNAIAEMIRQKGLSPVFDSYGLMRKGVIVRHLILPSHIENSIEVLQHLNNNFGNTLYISLMSQYLPVEPVKNHPVLGRTINKQEYDRVVNTLYELGFSNGWIQDFNPHLTYHPDFSKKEPFR